MNSTNYNTDPHFGPNARRRGIEKEKQILHWLLRWGFSDPDAIAEMLGICRSATLRTLKKLREVGYIKWLRTPRCPVTIMHLTPDGRDTILDLLREDNSDDANLIIGPTFSSEVETRSSPAHDLLVQRAVNACLRGDLVDSLNLPISFESFRTPLQLKSAGRKSGIWMGSLDISKPKFPDAILLDAQEEKWPLEMQQTRELDATAERKLSNYAEAAKNGRIVGCIYVTTRPAISEQLLRLIENPKGLPSYMYDAKSKRWDEGVGVRFTTPKINVMQLSQDIERRYYHRLRN